MATFKIISHEEDSIYYTIVVTVNGVEYTQTIISNKTGAALETFLQSYADDYQAGIDAQQVAPTE